MCPYCQIGEYLGTCTCGVDGKICVFMYRCTVERRWRPLPDMKRCVLREKTVGVKKLQPNEHKVRFESKGKLYVEYKDEVIKVDNPFDYVPVGVRITMVDGTPYVKDFEPKSEKTQKGESKHKKKK